jgi:hypothetical protein
MLKAGGLQGFEPQLLTEEALAEVVIFYKD